MTSKDMTELGDCIAFVIILAALIGACIYVPANSTSGSEAAAVAEIEAATNTISTAGGAQ